MIWRQISFWDGLFSGFMLISGSAYSLSLSLHILERWRERWLENGPLQSSLFFATPATEEGKPIIDMPQEPEMPTPNRSRPTSVKHSWGNQILKVGGNCYPQETNISPPKGILSRWFSDFPKGGICIRSLEGTVALVWFDLGHEKSIFHDCTFL